MTILLWIGRILLAILAAVLILLLMILFVPVRYRIAGNGSRETGAAGMKADVTWLFRLVHLSVSFRKEGDGTEKMISFRVLGIDPKKRRRAREERKREVKKQRKKKRLSSLRRSDPEEYERLKKEAAERKRIREEERRRKREEEQLRREAEKRMLRAEEDRHRKMIIRVRKSLGIAERIVRAVVSVVVKAFWLVMDLLGILIALPPDVASCVEKICTKTADICDTIREWVQFLTDPGFRGAAKRIIWAAKKLLIHLKPRTLKGDITFGFEDPSVTGRLLAGVMTFYPLYAGDLQVIPDFSEQAFCGSIEGSGRVILFYAAYVALRTWFDKDVAFARKFLKEKKEGADNG